MTSVLLGALQRQILTLDHLIDAELDALRVLGTPALKPRFPALGGIDHEHALLRAIYQREKAIASLKRTLDVVLAARMESAA